MNQETMERAKAANSLGISVRRMSTKQTFVIQENDTLTEHELVQCDIDAAWAELQKQAAATLANLPEKQAITLADLGFSSNKQVVKIEHKKLSNAQLVQHYKERYPQYPFLTRDILNRICKKYGLIFGPASIFVGTIPATCIQQIKEGEDAIHLEDHRMLSGDWGLEPIKDIKLVGPPDSFKKDGMEVVNYELVEHRENELQQDPIALYPVKGGYLVLAAWGPEASIPEIQND